MIALRYLIIVFLFVFVKYAQNERVIPIVHEKVYIQTNKQNYTVGDTLWFKAYVTNGQENRLSGQSEAVYVELINQKDSVQKTIKVQVNKGVGFGDIILEDEIKQGAFRLRAYTQAMRNSDPVYFFDKSFFIRGYSVKGIKAKANYEFVTKGNQSSILLKLNYKGLEGNPLSGQQIRYNIVSERALVSKGTSKTDALGNITVEVQQSDKINLEDSYLESFVDQKRGGVVTKTFPLFGKWSESDVQFFPEGGVLLAGVKNRIGFRALGQNGKGIAITGKVVDGAGHLVGNILASHAGIGSFEIDMKAGVDYSADIQLPSGQQVSYKLPKARTDAYQLSCSLRNTRQLISVRTNDPGLGNNKDLSVVIKSGGATVYEKSVSMISRQATVEMELDSLPMGVARVELINKNAIVNSRTIFINNRKILTAKLKLNKSAFVKKELVRISAESMDQKELNGNFSATVARLDTVQNNKKNEVTIFSSLLLSSDLKGYIEEPNYYFLDRGERRLKALDDLLLTQQLDKYEKTKGSAVNQLFDVEKARTVVSGKVTTLDGRPAVNAKVTMVSLNSNIMEETKSDEAGKFAFDGIKINQGTRFTIQGRLANNSDRLIISVDEMPPMSLSLNPNRAELNMAMLDMEQNDIEAPLYFGAKSRSLKEVNIRAQLKTEIIYTKQIGNVVPDGHADQTYIMRDAEHCASLGQCLRGMLHGVEFKEYQDVIYCPWAARDPVPMNVFLDGRKIMTTAELKDIFDNNVLDPLDIGKIEVVRTNLALKAMLGGESLLIITKKKEKRDKLYTPNITNYYPLGFAKPHSFFLPDYSSGQFEFINDYRTAVYWNPKLIGNGSNKIDFSFYTSDQPGMYEIVFEGINDLGYLCRQVAYYEVK
ncbi:carboxypeptidase-like regulatory domain-containing protein [Pedobacter sp. PWIIR3]